MRYNDTSDKNETQALDNPLKLTRFLSQKALAKKELHLSLRTLAGKIERQTATSKDKLPWLKLATFGDIKSDKGCLRTNANVATITGLEADYDAGQMTPKEARDKLAKAGIAAVIYTTPSHTDDAPRWRVLSPFSGPLPPEAREEHMARLNGVLDGALAGESFTLSQAYYAGNVEGRAKVQTFLVDGQPIDKANGLKPIYKDGGKTKPERTKNTDEKTGLPYHEIKDAMMYVPNTSANPKADDREWWLGMLAALHHETDGGEEGLELAHDWSKLHDSYDPEATDAAWDSFRRGSGKTGATILSEARFYGWVSLSAFDELWTPEELAAIDRKAKTEKPRLTFLSPSECEDLPARRYVIKGLLAEGDIATIVGAPGAGKSLLAPYLGYAVARGDRAFGRRTRQGGVFYVAAEDSHGMRARLKALREEHGDADSFKLVEGVSDLLTPNAPDLKALAKAAKAQRPALIVIDTMAVAFPGLEENDAKSMGQVVAVARHLTRWGAAVVLIHHDTKDGGNGLPRGHSILNGALDSNLYLKRNSGVVTGKLTKNRNGSTDEELAFTVEVMPFGEDEDGDPKTAAFCREAEVEYTLQVTRLTPSARAALKVFHDIGKGAPVDEDLLRNECVDGREVSASDKKDSRAKAFKRAVEELTRKNVLIFSGDQYAVVDSPEALFGDEDV
ncbi:AAA family ATPase [Sulfitobacter geojensis]|uniref:AAA family ATPase n=1 Tax=Sulfitobacter geojensis TaxID=1342299 RepID=UPI003B8B576C